MELPVRPEIRVQIQSEYGRTIHFAHQTTQRPRRRLKPNERYRDPPQLIQIPNDGRAWERT